MRGATGHRHEFFIADTISIRAPHAGCDDVGRLRLVHRRISIRAPHAGCDGNIICEPSGNTNFNPRTPCGVRLQSYLPVSRRSVFQSAHPMRGATAKTNASGVATFISIRAPHAGCDQGAVRQYQKRYYFNPRTPCGVRPFRLSNARAKRTFQSAHPMRGATQRIIGRAYGRQISIRAPHAGCDTDGRRISCSAAAFQSAHPMRGATRSTSTITITAHLFQSAHPMRGATARCSGQSSSDFYFNPRTPCGVRRRLDVRAPIVAISIRAPHAGCD